MLSILTFNAALQNIRFFDYSVYCPVKYVSERLTSLTCELLHIDADIMLVQEVFHRDIQDDLYNKLKNHYPYATGFSRSGLKLRLGNELLIFSKLPLSHGRLIRFNNASTEEKLFTSKGFYHTAISITGVGKVELINFHTTAGGIHSHPENQQMEKIRSQQIKQMLTYIKDLKFVILAGDLNAGPHTSTSNYRQVIDANFSDTSSSLNNSLITWDPENPLVTNGSESHLPAQAIDHIFVNKDLSDFMAPTETKVILDKKLLTTPAGRIPLSDHYGLLTIFKIFSG